MYELKSRRYQLIECTVGTQQAMQQYSFQQQPLLQSVTGGQQVFVEAIEVYAANAIGGSPISPSNTIATGADIKVTTLTLSVLGMLRFKNLPLAKMNNIWSDTGGGYVPFSWNQMLFCNVWGIDWTQCYLTTTAAVSAVPMSFMFGVYFEYSTDPAADKLQ